MKNLLLILLTIVVAACSTASPKAKSGTTPGAETASSAGTAAAAETASRSERSSPEDLSGRWTGKWTGTGLLASPREDAVILDLVQTGKAGYGRLVIDGATAAESVPVDIRYAGLWGIRVHARISGNKVTLRHEAGGHLFTADLKVAPDGRHLYGLVRGGHPQVTLVLTREGAPAPQAAMADPPPVPAPVEAPKAEPKVVVLAPEPEPKQPEPPARAPEDQLVSVAQLAPIHFDFDKAEIRKDAADTLTTHINWLKDHAEAVLVIEGHCDEIGTDEYNMALGERRAKAVGELLAAHGISPDRIQTTSFGRERPVCTDKTEECRMKNRRAEFRVVTR